MHFLDAGSGLRLLDCVDHTAMTAGGQHDETFAFDDEVRSNLVLEFIGNEAAGVLCRRNFVRGTPEPVDDPDLLAAWPQRFFETALCDLAGGEGMVSNEGRPFGHHEREVRVQDCLSVKRPILASSGLAHAKAILAADEERQTLFEPPPVRREEADQPTEMIVMAMAQHQCIEASGVDFQHRHIVEEGLRLIAEVDLNVPHLVAAPGFRVHRQSPLSDQVHARRCVRAQIAARPPLDGQPVSLLSRDPFDDLVIRDDPHRDAVHFRRLGGQLLGLCGS